MKRYLFLIALILFSTSVYSMGLSSEDFIVNIDFKPGFEGTYTYLIVPYTRNPIDVEIYVKNDPSDDTVTDMTPYFTLSDTKFTDVITGRQPYYTVKLKLPDNIEEPGPHRVRVGAREIPKQTGGVVVTTAVEAVFTISVPYEGKYLKSSLSVNGVNQGVPIPLSLSLYNLGKETIQKIYSDISIFDVNKKNVFSKTTDTIKLASKESRTFNYSIQTKTWSPGKYLAEAIIYHDGLKTTLNKTFRVGELLFDITNATSEIYSGEIVPIFITVESAWAETIRNVYADIKIGTKNPVRTISDDVIGFEKKDLKAFFDARDIEPGIYDMTVNLYYGGKRLEKIYKINILKKGWLEMPNITLSAANVLFLAAIMVIIIINIALYMILMKKKDENKKE